MDGADADHLLVSARLADGTTGLFMVVGEAEGLARTGYYTIDDAAAADLTRSEEHTSELQSLMRISYAVFCLKKKTQTKHNQDKPRAKPQITTTATTPHLTSRQILKNTK